MDALFGFIAVVWWLLLLALGIFFGVHAAWAYQDKAWQEGCFCLLGLICLTGVSRSATS